jgi:Lysyl oxidase
MVRGFGLLISSCVVAAALSAEGASHPEHGGPHFARVELDKKGKASFWKGTVTASEDPHVPAPPECSGVPCDHIQLKIDLPGGTFKDPNLPGGVQVAIRWRGEFDTLHLWVYKQGALRAASPGIIATSQSALLKAPENGIYDVWVAWDFEYNVSPLVDYEGLADVELGPKIHPVRRLLPDLAFRSTERISFDTPSFPIFEPDPPPGSSCFVSEMVEDGAQNCLRFDQIIANESNGPLELWFTVPTGSSDDAFPVTQRVHYSDGTTKDQAGGEVHFHPIHGHYHYESFATSELWASNAQGEKLGSAPATAAKKVSFCIADIRLDKWGQKGDGPRTYMAPDCLLPAFSDAEGDHYRQGLTPGWADVYDWYIPDQYIEVTGVPDGYYRLEFCADPGNTIEETNEDDNCLVNHILLTAMGTPQRSVTVLGVIKESKKKH